MRCFLWDVQTLWTVKNRYCFYYLPCSPFYLHNISRTLFLPIPVILIVFNVWTTKEATKRLTTKQYNSSIVFYNSLILFPQRFKRNYCVPFTSCCSIGEVAENHIYRLVWYLLHFYQAVSLYDGIEHIIS